MFILSAFGHQAYGHCDISFKGNLLSPHRLLFPISIKSSIICTFPLLWICVLICATGVGVLVCMQMCTVVCMCDVWCVVGIFWYVAGVWCVLVCARVGGFGAWPVCLAGVTVMGVCGCIAGLCWCVVYVVRAGVRGMYRRCEWDGCLRVYLLDCAGVCWWLGLLMRHL